VAPLFYECNMYELLRIPVNTGGRYYHLGTAEFPVEMSVSNELPYPIVVTLVPYEDTPVDQPDEAPTEYKKEDKMSRHYNEDLDMYVEEVTESEKQRAYLFNRLEVIRYGKVYELEQKFGLRDEDYPKNFNEWVERINAGRYVFNKPGDKEGEYWRNYIRWRDPDLKEDVKGYNAALELLNKEHLKTKDIIAIKSVDDGLDALQSLESWKSKK
jgi:hypothetical protein